MENCTFGEYPAVLAKLKLLANTSIYWPKSRLANESEQITRPLLMAVKGLWARERSMK
jgi:hypothetical protein